ncbi:MAG TPA: BadF/BadG/BcrA/BcrD ATPase family protein, partial [Rectinemataceae bacterium]
MTIRDGRVQNDPGETMGERWYFGLDGGGTSCRLRVESSDAILIWKGEGKAANPRSVGWDETKRVVGELFARLYQAAGLDPADCAGGFAGLAGIGRPTDRQITRDIVREAARIACPIEADNDALPALVG